MRQVGLLLARKDGGNLLTRQSLLQLYEVDLLVRGMYNNTPEYQWKDICFTPGHSQCIPASVLELWNYNKTEISLLTQQQIDDKINSPNLVSPMTSRNITLEKILGGLVRDTNGRIISASVVKVNYQLKKRDVYDSSAGENIDKFADAWEEALEDLFKDREISSYTVYTYSKWSQKKVSNDSAGGDRSFLVFGYLLVIIYMTVQLGSFSRIGNKFVLALVGILIIGLSIGISFGLGSALQLEYTRVHNVLPFLLLGIGVDDIFVIVQAWENIGGPKPDHRSIAEKVAVALKHAGVSILVTSVTDICTFAIGSVTILPALRSFSVWCAIGILAIFLLTITLFTAVLTLDARRQQQRRDALLCCLKLSANYESTQCSQKHYLKEFLKNYYSPALLSTPGKVLVLFVAAALLAFGSYGLSELEQNSDFIWHLPTTSRPRLYVEKDREAFPGNGNDGNVYIGKIDYYNGQYQMDKIKNSLDNNQYVSKGTVDSWYHHYKNWLIERHYAELIPANCSINTCRLRSSARFNELLFVFLKTSDGRRYQRMLKFDNNTKEIIASIVGYTHPKFIGTTLQTKAMESVTDAINIGTEPLLPFAFSQSYLQWETNKVISKELVRNLALGGACILVITFFLLSNVMASLIVVACVAFSLIEIAAFMGFWGLTIDTATTIILLIAIGLTVDYSAHIAHAFMVARKNSRNDRAAQALHEVGPAVIHGGISTFLAFALLFASQSYVFVAFFKVFFLVIIFGMFHGIVFLPVILSLIGPSPYADVRQNYEDDVEQVNNAKSDNPVTLEKSPSNTENFVVVLKDGEKNLAYVPE